MVVVRQMSKLVAEANPQRRKAAKGEEAVKGQIDQWRASRPASCGRPMALSTLVNSAMYSRGLFVASSATG